MTQPDPAMDVALRRLGIQPGRETHEMQPAQTRSCFPLPSQCSGVSVSVPLKWGESLTSQGLSERRGGESSPAGELGMPCPPPTGCLPPRAGPHCGVLRTLALAANCKY